MALGLAGRGHSVLVLTGFPNYPGGKLFRGYGVFGPYKEELNGVAIRRAPLVPRGSASNVRLAINYISHAVSSSILFPFLIPESIDGILVFEPSPITIGVPARIIRWVKHAPVAFWIQDLWPQSLSATGAIRSKPLLDGVEMLTRWVYRGCDRVLVQSEAFVEHVAAQGVPRELIEYVPNSAESFYRPQPPSPAVASNYSLPSGFRVMFAGNLGAAQDLPTLIDAADILRNHRDIHWVLIGDGRMRQWVAEQISSRRLGATVHLMDSMPPESMPALFAHASVLLASLRREAIFAYTIPSKVQSYLACGKPVIASLDGEGARIVLESGAGWSVPSQSPNELARTVLAASRLPARELDAMGSRAEAFFRKNFERELLLSRLESLLTTMKFRSP